MTRRAGTRAAGCATGARHTNKRLRVDGVVVYEGQPLSLPS